MNTNWDHLRHFNALALHGTLSEAARHLGVSHSTVQRHIAAFENELQVQLFNQVANGFRLTAAGAKLYEESSVIQQTLQSITSRISGTDDQMQGTVRITVTDTFGHFLLPELLKGLQKLYPQVSYCVNAANSFSNILDLEADIAVRTGGSPPADLIGRQVGAITFAVCASRQYLQEHTLQADDAMQMAEHFICLESNTDGTFSADWLPQRSTPITPTTVNGFLNAWRLCSAGLGLALLPAYLCDFDEQLVQVNSDNLPQGNKVWVLSHADLRDSPRVKAVRQYLTDKLGAVFDTTV